MDTSPEYIKMCEKATEVQTDWTPEEWDLYYAKPLESSGSTGDTWAVLPESIADSGVYGRVFVDKGKVIFDCSTRNDYIWLPRQDQLQEMVDNGQRIHPFWRFTDFLNGQYNEKSHQCTWIVFANMSHFGVSMEQLWLAFVMLEKFNKTWTGEEWE